MANQGDATRGAPASGGARGSSGGGTLSLPEGWDLARDLVVIVGSGAAAFAEAFLRVGQVRLFAYRPPDSPAEPLPAGVSVVTGFSELFGALVALPGEIPQHIVLPKTTDPGVTPEMHRGVGEEVKRALESRRLQAVTVAKSGPAWLLHGIENLDAIARIPSVEALNGAFPGVPCIIASPGPSLSRNIAQLPSLRERALLMSGTHCLSALHRLGLTPDIVIAADAGDLARHYKGVDASSTGALIVSATCRAESYRLPARQRASFAGNESIDDWIYECLGEDAGLATGGSVACSEFSLARRMGCDPIVFVGQDLSFSEGRYYAEECGDGDSRVALGDDGASFFLRKPAGEEEIGALLPDGSRRFSFEQEVVRVRGYHGGEVSTSLSFRVFLSWFEAEAQAIRGKVRVQNCTEGGAFIEGMEHLPLATAAAAFPDRDLEVTAVLERTLGGAPVDDRRSRLAHRVGEMVASLDPCLEISRRCASLAERALRDQRALEKLGRAEKELQRALRPVPLFNLFAQGEIIEAQEEGRKATDLRSRLAASRTLFRVVERAVHSLREPLVQAQARLLAEDS
jgi:hypothetical protein